MKYGAKQFVIALKIENDAEHYPYSVTNVKNMLPRKSSLEVFDFKHVMILCQNYVCARESIVFLKQIMFWLLYLSLVLLNLLMQHMSFACFSTFFEI